MIPICNAVERYRRVVIAMGSQMGKTAGLLNIIGQKLDDDPAPILYFGPTKSNIDGVVEPQIQAMLRSAPSLWAKTEKGRSSKKLIKKVSGVPLRLAWAGSPTELASQPAHTVLADEVDRMDPIPGEGDPLTLAEARIATFPDGRIVITSSPTEGNVEPKVHPDTGIEHWAVAEKTEDVSSVVWRLWQEGTRFEWAVPCPHCNDYFVPRFSLLRWPEKCTPRQSLKQTRLQCRACGTLIEDAARASMNARGHFLAPGQRVVDGAVVGDPPDSDTASFWVSGLMSPWRSWGQRAAAFLDAVKSADQDRVRSVINTGLGELYSFRGEAKTPDVVRENVAAYAMGTLPEAVQAITCGVDVQKRRLVFAVRGWGYNMESWLIDRGDIWGDTDEPQVWAELDELLKRTYQKAPTADKPNEPGASLPIRRCGIDSGYRPGEKWRRPDNLIYEFCHRRGGRRVVPTKGRDHLQKPLQASLIDVTFKGMTHKQGLQLWHMDSDYFKSWIHARLTWPVDQAGRYWVPQDVDDDYCLQMTSETRSLKPSGQAVWIRVRPENHFFDCEVINVAMAQSLGYHRKVKGKGTVRSPESQGMGSGNAGTPSIPGSPGSSNQQPSMTAPQVARPRQASTPGQFRRSNWATKW